jgi:hypothetical protein
MTIQETIREYSNYDLFNEYHSVLKAENAGSSQWLAVIAIYENEMKHRGIERPDVFNAYTWK